MTCIASRSLRKNFDEKSSSEQNKQKALVLRYNIMMDIPTIVKIVFHQINKYY